MPSRRRTLRLDLEPDVYEALASRGVVEIVACEALNQAAATIRMMQQSKEPPENIIVVAATTATANFWVQLNSAALGGLDGRGALVVTAGNENIDRLRGVQADRLVIISPIDRDLEQEAMVCLRKGPMQVIRVTFSDRLAAAWRDAA